MAENQTTDPLAILAAEFDPEAYRDDAWFDPKMDGRAVAFMADLRDERRSKAERRAICAYAKLRAAGFDITARAE